ncbi:hypothetical protein PVAND_013992 [Polypedilum vanderplanki]|uniref:tRNA (adenine(58)-N(1))-methyltransferase non-catalytic subunit TRM6 n=1 Tax=Polypedilum vanderplanki TaxID=319348 RepID=A0A9J6CT59_POLVA|nr:hypothetical protein PVAND_013992 [Polypedilum vanderplanki]
MDDTIKVGQYIIVQRQNFTKLHKFSALDSTVTLGKEMVELKNIAGQNFFQTFKMKLIASGKKRLHELEICDNATNLKDILTSIESGSDNRNILDDGKSQSLSYEEIINMRQTLSDSKEIIGTIIANSNSFNQKTEFSQEKYIKKKEKKYFEFIQVRKPTLRLLTEIFYRQDPEKALGLRMDSLSQLISYSGVNSMGNYLIYESGSSGLVPAAFLNSMGDHGDARLVHLHPGNFPQMQAVYALNLTDHHLKRCSSVNIYSVLRQYYQGIEENVETLSQTESENEKMDIDESSRKRKLENDDTEDDNKPPKRQNFEEDENNEQQNEVPISDENSSNTLTDREEKKRKWQLDNDEAIRLFKEKFDSLTIVAKEDPFPIVKELLPFIHNGRPVVIFHACKEVLMECYTSLKNHNLLINVRLFSNFMRDYQVLPMRTHPAIQLQGNSGWLLVGYTVNHGITLN